MQRIKWGILWWLVSCVSHDMVSGSCPSQQGICGNCSSFCPQNNTYQNTSMTYCCLKSACSSLNAPGDTIKALKNIETILENTEINGSMEMPFCNLVIFVYKPNCSKHIEMYANDIKADMASIPNPTVKVQLPEELGAGPNNNIVFSVFTFPETNGNVSEVARKLYNRKLVGLIVQKKKISGLRERVNITMPVTEYIYENQNLSCRFLNLSTGNYIEDGCETLWTRNQSNVTCSCDHLTYFGVLLTVSINVSQKDAIILKYISIIGCSVSLFALAITVLLFISNRTLRLDVSMKVHINLAISLIILNLHFLLSSTVAAVSSTGVCLYMALVLHYSLLATFSWMALEGFHLYLLLVKVFNIYIKRYLLKLSVVGWGVPAIIVSVVVIIDRSFYGPVAVDNSTSSVICYITNETVKVVTTIVLFGLVFLFNVILFVITLWHILMLRRVKEFGQHNRDRAKKDICTLLGVITLLGITWGLIFFSFGYLTTPGLYLFCILNSLQGFFIFLWFAMSLRKTKDPRAMATSETATTSK
ncbi:adhesion G-protein coupled receptor G5-like [Oreochromis aureus]|uniref:adhesion G-protein coupled receptor G5-like n=1 Tax=Oreochromis aureus TaxID=47969 RepID=UPI001952F95C|nr:adhesion G-protein coupled receptor G5-like [Oreochromis aureus]